MKSIAKIKEGITSNITSHLARSMIMNELRIAGVSDESINLRYSLIIMDNKIKLRKEIQAIYYYPFIFNPEDCKYSAYLFY